RAENSASSIATMASLSSPTPTLISKAKNRNAFTRCASLRATCGASKPRRTIPSTWICGMTILSRPDPIREPERRVELPQLPRDEGGPVFAEPWQAQAFALAVKLSEQGYFTWKEWAAALTDELKAAANRGEPDDGS